MFTSGQVVHFFADPSRPAVVCTVKWEGVHDRAGVQVVLLEDATTGRRFPAKATRITEIPASLGICHACYLQPCQCANRRRPGWVQALAAELDRTYGPEVPRE